MEGVAPKGEKKEGKFMSCLAPPHINLSFMEGPTLES